MTGKFILKPFLPPSSLRPPLVLQFILICNIEAPLFLLANMCYSSWRVSSPSSQFIITMWYFSFFCVCVKAYKESCSRTYWSKWTVSKLLARQNKGSLVPCFQENRRIWISHQKLCATGSAELSRSEFPAVIWYWKQTLCLESTFPDSCFTFVHFLTGISLKIAIESN